MRDEQLKELSQSTVKDWKVGSLVSNIVEADNTPVQITNSYSFDRQKVNDTIVNYSFSKYTERDDDAIFWNLSNRISSVYINFDISENRYSTFGC